MTDKNANSGSSGSASHNSFSKKVTGQAHRVAGWLLMAPGEAVQWASNLSRSTLAWGSLALAAVMLLSLNLAASVSVRDVKADLTQDHLYTISKGTKEILSSLQEPINVKVYYSHRLGEIAPTFARQFERLKGLLEQYSALSAGKLQVTFLDPEPFSDAEDRASAAGLKGQRLNQEGETGYFGLVASNLTDNDAVVPFFTPDRERFLEYDLTKLINGLANPKKKVIGLLTSLQLDGGVNPMNPRGQPQRPWMIMEQIRDFFDVRPLKADIKEIPKDIDVLMLVQPTVLTKDAAYAIDQYALGGGRVLAFLDPVADAAQAGGPMGMGALPISQDVRKIVHQWGLDLDVNKVVGDPSLARRVQFPGGPGGQPIVTDYLAWLQIEQGQINGKDPLAASINKLNLSTVGALKKVEGATTIIQPLIDTTAQSGLIDADLVKFQPNPLTIMKDFKSGGKPLMIAARIGGEAKTAYPRGRPKDEAKADDSKKDAAATGDTKAGDKPAEVAKDGKAGAPKAVGKAATEAPDKTHIAAGRVNIVVVADSDLLADHFWVEVRDFLGQQVALPQADNATFVVNALENLSGGAALSGLRGRGVVDRPFDRVNQIRRSAELQFRQKEQGLVAKLQDLQQKLARVEAKGPDGNAPQQVILSDAEKAEIEKFRGEMLDVRRQLREVKAALRRDIDSLDRWLKFFNIAAIPLLIGFGGLGLAWARRRNGRNGS